MSEIKGFFFDLDGTLVDTYEADYLAYRQAIEDATGVDVPRAEFMKLRGKEIRAKLAILLPELTEQQIVAITERKKQVFPAHLNKTIPNEELIGFLRLLSRSGSLVVLVTTAKEGNALSVLQHHYLRSYFTHIVHGGEARNHKPHPETYLIALEKTGLNPDQVIAFEDAQPGIDSAHAAGIRCVRIQMDGITPQL
jgi:HAD superfamily hydrolase (TIGR01509 family)